MLLLLMCATSCRKKTSQLKIGLFDISSDDKSILFSLSNNGKISILSIDIDNGNLRGIVKSTFDSNYYNPKFSPDGSKILFFGSKRNNSLGCSMFIADKDGRNKQEILRDSGEIIEAVFSSCENKIYYIKSNEFGNYSPLGRSQPHNSDVYSIRLSDHKIEQITNLKAYNMYRISEFDCGKITLNMTGSDKKGLLMFTMKDPNQMIDINPLNNPRKDNSFYTTPFYSKKYKIMGFIAPYELYTMDMNDRIGKLILYDEDMVKYYRFYNNHERIVYTNQNKPSFYIIDLKGVKIKEVDVESLFAN
jgi:Tol biopolymer transport system component